MLLPDVLPPDELYGVARLVVHKALSMPEVVEGSGVLVVIGEDPRGHLRYVGSVEIAPDTARALALGRRRVAIATAYAARWALAWVHVPTAPLPDRHSREVVVECGVRDDPRVFRFVARCALADRMGLGPRGDIRYEGLGDSLPAPPARPAS